MRAVSVNVHNSQAKPLPRRANVQKPSGVERSAPTAEFPFQGGPRPLFRLEIYSAVSMRFRWRPVRTRRRQSRSKLPEVGSEGHFGRALAPLLVAKVAQCCMCEKTYYLLCFDHIRQGLGILFSAAGEASQRRGHTVRSFSLFLNRLERHAAPKGRPKGPQGLPKPPQKHPKIVLKSVLGPTWAPKPSRRSKKVPA